MNIIVLAGGVSTERDVSFSTGKEVCDALRRKGHDAAMLDVFLGYDEDVSMDFFKRNDAVKNMEKVKKDAPDIESIKAIRANEKSFFGPNVLELCNMADLVFIALHGADGENGKIQATFDLFGIAYTGPGYLGSALSMDKNKAKIILDKYNIPVPSGYSMEIENRETKSKIGYPCVVKPACGGSSVGVSIVNNDAEFEVAVNQAFGFEKNIVVEKYIKGREFSVGLIDGKSLPIIEIIPLSGFYDYETKYKSGMAKDVCPAELSDEQSKRMRALAEKAYAALGLSVYSRIDFLMDAKGDMFCLEANTLPGMTPTSLLPQEAKVAGMDFEDLCEKIIDESIKYRKKS